MMTPETAVAEAPRKRARSQKTGSAANAPVRPCKKPRKASQEVRITALAMLTRLVNIGVLRRLPQEHLEVVKHSAEAYCLLANLGVIVPLLMAIDDGIQVDVLLLRETGTCNTLLTDMYTWNTVCALSDGDIARLSLPPSYVSSWGNAIDLPPSLDLPTVYNWLVSHRDVQLSVTLSNHTRHCLAMEPPLKFEEEFPPSLVGRLAQCAMDIEAAHTTVPELPQYKTDELNVDQLLQLAASANVGCDAVAAPQNNAEDPRLQLSVVQIATSVEKVSDVRQYVNLLELELGEIHQTFSSVRQRIGVLATELSRAHQELLQLTTVDQQESAQITNAIAQANDDIALPLPEVAEPFVQPPTTGEPFSGIPDVTPLTLEELLRLVEPDSFAMPDNLETFSSFLLSV